MKILVAISKVPDTTARIEIKDNKINETGLQWIINPYDEWYALSKAVGLKEKDAAIHVTVFSVGDNSTDALLRKALSYGADEAVRIDAAPADSFFVAEQIAAYVQTENFDLVLTGKESIDYHQGATGGILAGLLGYPYVSLATSLEISDHTAIVEHDTEGGSEKAALSLPAVISCTKGMAAQRTPNMRGIMAARTKPLKTIQAIDAEPFTEVINYEIPQPKGAVKMFDNVQDLVAALKAEKLI